MRSEGRCLRKMWVGGRTQGGTSEAPTTHPHQWMWWRPLMEVREAGWGPRPRPPPPVPPPHCAPGTAGCAASRPAS